MKLEYKTEVEETREVVAEAFHMAGYPEEVCLNFYNIDGHNVVTLYYDGLVTVQPDFDTGDCSIKKFYKGDTITITF